MPRIKICALTRPCDIDYVNTARPDWCGFIINFPKSRRSLTPEQVRPLRERLDPSITAVGVFVDRPPEEIAALLLDGTIDIAQLHGNEDAAYFAALRSLAPGKELWRAFRVRSPDDFDGIHDFPADRILLDSGQGSGLTFDWSLAALAGRPFLLAGGLTPENLPEAIRTARPWGVDLSSGVETGGFKDFQKICAAVRAARKD